MPSSGPEQSGAISAPVRRARSQLALVPLLTILVMLGPVLAGLGGTVLPAFGYFPAAGAQAFSLAPFQDLLAWPGFAPSVRLSVTTGLIATVVSLGVVTLIAAGWIGSRAFALLQRLLSPLLSVPHAAAAFGLAFLIAPSGWLVRLVSPWATGWQTPPDVLIVQDPWGLAMTAGLIFKEVPFLLLMTLAALGQTNSERSMAVARALGYGRVSGWMKVVFPRVYAQIRLPVYVVLAYSMSVVDVAIVLGPNTPPPLSVQIVRWMNDPDLGLRLQAAAGALVQFAVVLAALAFWRVGEAVIGKLGKAWIARGARGFADAALRSAGMITGVISALAVLLGLLGLIVWSFAGFWSYPEIFPDVFTLRSWQRHLPSVIETFGETLLIAGVSTFIALVLSLGCLEAEHRYDLRFNRGALALLYLPLLVPQTAFLPGLQTFFLTAGISIGRLPVILTHIVFVLPYVFLSLGDPFRAWDGRFARIAQALGAGPEKILWQLRLPMLLAPVLTATAVGVAVSVGQYLPTLLVGGGRVSTLATEAVALAAGGDRRAIGVYGVSQTVAALLPFAMAVLVPAIVWRNRKELRNG